MLQVLLRLSKLICRKHQFGKTGQRSKMLLNIGRVLSVERIRLLVYAIC